ncbi:MAG: SPOR domain-containing protein [Planctomycetes bacterium]|nr:SPOR domain-containing protein [Planctomycetota bacterium]
MPVRPFDMRGRTATLWRKMMRVAIPLFLLTILGGCSQLTESQRGLLDAGLTAYEKQDYSKSVDRLTAFLSEVKAQPERSRAAYVRGMSQIKLNRRSEAYADLRLATDAPADPDSIWRAYVMLSTLHFEDGRYDAALRMAVAAVGRMPNDGPKDAMLYRQGVCYERLARWEDSRRPFQQAAENNPGSVWGQAARRRVALKPRHFAVQCGAFADPKNAASLRARLAAAGFDTYVRQEQRGSTMSNLVLVGRYSSFGEALTQLTAVRRHVSDAVLWP